MSKGGGSLKVKKYYLSILYSVCLGPIDAIKEIRFDDKIVASGTFTDGTLTIDKEELYGGMDREGGVSGNIDIMLGYPNQAANSFYASKYPNPPAFRGSVTLLLKDFYVGMNYYLKPFSVVARKITATRNGTNTWQNAYIEPIPGQMNGVHILRDLLISQDGLGISESNIGTSFDTAAVTCFNEGLGFSFFFNDGKEISHYIDILKSHLNAEVYEDRVTGKYEIKLVRQDYNINTIPRLTSAVIKEISSLKRTLLGELFSKVTLKYTNGTTWKEAVHVEENFTLSTIQGGAVEKNIEFLGCTSRALAAKLAARELKEVSTPTFAGTLTGNTSLATLNIGDVFIIDPTANPYCDFDIVCRVAGIDLGTVLDNKVKITFIEDIFASQEAYQFSVDDSGWTDVINNPQPVTEQKLVEIPYYLIAKIGGDAKAKAIETTDCLVAAIAVQPTDDSLYAKVLIAGTEKATLTFCGYGLSANVINKTTTTITLINTNSIQLFKNGEFIQIDNEIMGIVSRTVNVLTVLRGCLDTVPTDHVQNSKVYAWQNSYGYPDEPYFVGESINAQLLTVTSKGKLSAGSAPVMSLTTVGRLHLPYPPGNLQINSTSFANITTVTASNLILAWNTRNRYTQTVKPISYYSGNITSEANITYSAELRRVDNNSLLASFTGETLLTRTLTTTTTLTNSSITFVGTTATLTTSTPHGLVTGNKVTISGATPAVYNGTYTITVLNTTQFTYTVISTPSGNASTTGTTAKSIYVGQVKLSVWSNNLNGSSFQRVEHIFNLE